ncbi:hypothetical protein GQ42DRAFT_179792 [Ramicandelaber brevisporus]|nr:hypothetical protein GQ42DRAFT_179792 [Ramicandelaber brevisporus]
MPALSKFPAKLFDLLSGPTCPPIMRWSPDGTSFEITDKDLFEKEYLLECFPSMNQGFSTFKRQLTDHQFKNLRDGRKNTSDKSGEWRHDYFIRGCPELLTAIIRKKRDRGKGGREDEDTDADYATPPPAKMYRKTRSTRSTPKKDFCPIDIQSELESLAKRSQLRTPPVNTLMGHLPNHTSLVANYNNPVVPPAQTSYIQKQQQQQQQQQQSLQPAISASMMGLTQPVPWSQSWIDSATAAAAAATAALINATNYSLTPPEYSGTTAEQLSPLMKCNIKGRTSIVAGPTPPNDSPIMVPSVATSGLPHIQSTLPLHWPIGSTFPPTFEMVVSTSNININQNMLNPSYTDPPYLPYFSSIVQPEHTQLLQNCDVLKLQSSSGDFNDQAIGDFDYSSGIDPSLILKNFQLAMNPMAVSTYSQIASLGSSTAFISN